MRTFEVVEAYVRHFAGGCCFWRRHAAATGATPPFIIDNLIDSTARNDPTRPALDCGTRERCT